MQNSLIKSNVLLFAAFWVLNTALVCACVGVQLQSSRYATADHVLLHFRDGHLSSVEHSCS